MYGTGLGKTNGQALEDAIERKRMRNANGTDFETRALLEGMCEESPEVLFFKIGNQLT